MVEVYILYSADAWISRSSMVCMGVFSSFSNAMCAALEEIRKTDVDDEVYEDCYHDLINCLQTHGLEKNWHIKIVELDNFDEV